MKNSFLFLLLFFAAKTHAQTAEEAVILDLSKTIFKWEVENRIDDIERVFDDKFVVVGGDGVPSYKKQYMTTLRSGNFVHNAIDIEENVATVVNNTATVIGKAKFTVTIEGKKLTFRLAYIEVFTRKSSRKPWKVLAMHASNLPN
jgi:hypothetical protein